VVITFARPCLSGPGRSAQRPGHRHDCLHP